MKKITFIALLLTAAANAQFNYGVKGGLALSNLEVSKTVPLESKSKISYSAGVFTEYKFYNISVNLGLNIGEYGSKGITYRDFDPSNSKNPNVNVIENMITIDATGNYYFTDGFSIGTGVYYGIINGVNYDISRYGNLDVSDKHENSDFGILLKANYTLYKGLFIEGKYMFGIKDIYNNKEATNTLPDPSKFDFDGEAKNRIFILTLGYRFT